MAHTFDIRFARSAGLAGFFEAPGNSFRWKGAGSLRIDREGISIAARRGVHSLFAREQRVAAGDLREVLREGDALRLEFSTNKISRAVLPLWVRDPDLAAEIVRLLPTKRTVELDHDAAGVGRARFRPDWRVLSLLGVLLLGLASLAVLNVGQETPAPTAATIAVSSSVDRENLTPAVKSAPPSISPPAPGENPRVEIRTIAEPPADNARAQGTPPPVELEPPDPYAATDVAGSYVSAPAESMPEAVDKYAAAPRRVVYVQAIDGVVPIVPEMAVYGTARQQLDLFKDEVGPLDEPADVDNSKLWNATVRIYNDPALDHPDLRALRDMELAVSRAWRACSVVRSPACEFAQRLTERLDFYVE